MNKIMIEIKQFLCHIKGKEIISTFLFMILLISIIFQITLNYFNKLNYDSLIFQIQDSDGIINNYENDYLNNSIIINLVNLDNQLEEEDFDEKSNYFEKNIYEEEILNDNYTSDDEIEIFNNNIDKQEGENFGYNQTIDDDDEDNDNDSKEEEYESDDDFIENEKAKDFDLFIYLNKTYNISNETEINNITETINHLIEEGKLNKYFKASIINEKPKIFNISNKLFQFSTVLTEKKLCSKDNNFSSIDFFSVFYGNNLKRRFDENSDDIYLFKIDYYFDDYKIPVIEYNLYYRNENKTNTKIIMDEYKDKIAYYYLPVNINEKEEFKYNYENNFYNDICYSYSSNDKKDVTLYDRKEEFNNLNMSVCENGCIYVGYNFSINKVVCECRIKTSMKNYEDIIFNDAFFHFTNLKMKSNIYILKCAKTLFSKDGIKTNIAFYILSIIIIISIIECIIFFLRGFKLLRRKIDNIINLKFHNEIAKIRQKKKSANENDTVPKFLFYKSINVDELPNNSNSKTNILKQENKNDNNDYKEVNLNDNENKKEIKIKRSKVFMFYENDFEINILPYELAIEDGQKTYWEYYFSLIRSKHLLVLTFYTYNDYNSKIIKISLILLIIGIHYFVNALFFGDSTIHKIFKDNKKYNAFILLPLIIYSIVISYVAEYIFKLITLTEKSVIEIKNQPTLKLSKDSEEAILKQITIKTIIFYSLDFIILIFVWYYLSCFSAIYQQTQYILLLNTSVSLIITLIFPFIFFLLPGFLRIPSLQENNKNNEYKYKISQILQLL